jgi:hypothetical protein
MGMLRLPAGGGDGMRLVEQSAFIRAALSLPATVLGTISISCGSLRDAVPSLIPCGQPHLASHDTCIGTAGSTVSPPSFDTHGGGCTSAHTGAVLGWLANWAAARSHTPSTAHVRAD